MSPSRLIAVFLLLATAAGCSCSGKSASSTRSTIAASPASVAADGMATTTITVTAKDSSGNPISALAVALGVTGGTANVLTPASGLTGKTGTFTATLASTSAGMKTLTATLGTGSTAAKVSTTVSFTATAPAQANTTLTASPTTVTADGTSTTTLTVTVADADHNPVGGQMVSLASTGSHNTFAPASGLTDAAGVFKATLASTTAETKTVTATVGSFSLSTTATFTTGAPSTVTSTISVASPTLTADGTSTDLVVVTVLDAQGNPVDAAPVTLSGSGEGDKFQPTSGTTGVDGTFTSAFSTTTAGQPTLTATIGTGIAAIMVTTTVKASAGAFSATQSSLTARPPGATADGVSLITLTLTGKDANGNPLAGAPFMLTASGQSNNFSATSGSLDLNGQSTVMVSSTLAQAEVITAEIGSPDNAVAVPVTFVPGAPAKAVFEVQPTSTTAGIPFSHMVIVALQDQLGNVVTSDSSTVVSIALNTNGVSGASLAGTTSVTAIAGIARFPGLSVAVAGVGYSLQASAPGYAGAASATFNVTAGPMAKAAFTVQPSTTVAGATIAPAVVVTLQDALGNTILTDSTTQITLAIGTNPSSATLRGTFTAIAVAGNATFKDLTIQQAGMGYTLTATAPGYATATSSTFSITEGSMANAVFTTQPSNVVAGVAIAPVVTVTLEDPYGNPITTDSSTVVTVGFGTNPNNASLLGMTSATAVNGVATFPSLNIQRAGTGFTLTASANGYATATSTAFDVTAGAMGGLVFTSQPTSTTAGVTLSPSVIVTLQDSFGNTILTDSSTPVSLTLGTTTGSAKLLGTTTVVPASGVATFPDLSLQQAGTGYTLMAAAANYSGATSASFDISPAGPGSAVFTTQPTAAAAGMTLNPAVVVSLEDAFGNVIPTDSTSTVTLAVTSGSGTLLGTLQQTAANGVATFPDLSLQTADTYTLSASTTTGYATTTSAPFTITPAGPANAVFSGQPTDVVAGVTINPAVTVALEDQFGNVVTSDSTTAVTLVANLGSPTLYGTTTQTAVNGVATFPDLSLQQAGTWTLDIVAAGAYAGGQSVPFVVSTSGASGLAFTTNPSNTVAGTPIAPLTVALQDQYGNTIASDSSTVVTLAVESGPGTLLGTTSVTATNGVATFAGLTIDTAGAYTLVATASNYAGTVSQPFTVTAGAPANAVFTVGPTSTTAGSSFSPALQVTLEDQFGNTVLTDSSTTVTVAIATNAGGGTLSGTVTQTAVNGVATFANLSLNKTGTGYTLTATASGYASATSNAFNITAGAKANATFTTQPSNTVAGTAISPSVVVTLQDSYGNTIVTDSSTLVTIAIGNNAGGATLSGTATVAAHSGVATFPGLSLNRSGTSYTLTAAASGYAAATSSSFNISPGAKSKSVFSGQPSNAVAGASILPAVTVALEDSFGNIITSDSSTAVTIAIGNNAGGSTLSGLLTATASNGVATFANLSLNKSGMGYTLTATAPAYANATSNGFNITAGAKANAVFAVQPSSTTAGAPISVTVALQDALGNIITTDSSTTVTIAFATNPGGSTLSGTRTVTASNGVATFSNLSLNRVGTGYTLSATAAGYVSATSNAFNITTGAKANAVFAVQPSNAVAGTAFSPAVVVSLQDASGNVITTDSSTVVTVAIGNNVGGSTLSGTASVVASSGVATFPGLSLNKSGTGYTLTATAAGYSTGTSATFNITAGAKANAVFTSTPISVSAGSGIPVTVTLQDALGNTITSDSSTAVTLAIGMNPGGGTLTGAVTATASSGVATFTTDAINKAGSGYTLTATASGYAAGTSPAFNVTAGAKANAVFTTQPTNTVATANISPAVVVALQDGFGNTIVTDSTTTVTIAIGTNPGGSTLSGTTTVTASNGVATFSNLSLNKVGTAYTLTTSAPGYAGTTSAAFNISIGAASSTTSSVAASPPSVPADGTKTTLTATVQDAGGNPISGQTVTFTANGSANTFTATSCVTSAGTCSVQLSSTTIQTEMVTATIGSFQETTTVTFNNCLHGSQVFSGAGGFAFIAPPCMSTVTVKAWGAGGGGGGQGQGGYGGGGAYATSSVTVSPGESLTVIVGGGGGGGSGGCVTASGNGGGGSGYNGIGYGGPGGPAGATGCDAGGGGGGGGSFLLRGSTVLIAAGGGGGGGALEQSVGTYGGNGGGGGASGAAGPPVNCSVPMPGGTAGASSTTNGAGGYQDCNDGPGGGGGGGGYYGGGGGEVDCNVGIDCDNYPAGGGGGGTSLGQTVSNGAAVTPGNSGDADRGSAGNGGGPTANGNPGLVKIIW